MENIFCEKHIIGLIWTTILIIILTVLSKKIEKKIGLRKLLKIGALVLIGLELTKYTYYYMGDRLGISAFPIQFCSLMLYAYPVIAFGKGKIANFVLPFAFVGGLTAGLLALILPTNILGSPEIGWLNPKNFDYTLSFVYHAFMIYYSLYLVISGLYKAKLKDALNIVVIACVFATIAGVMNKIFDMDYMMLNKGNGDPFQFLIQNYGHVPYVAVHVGLLIVLSFLILSVTKFVCKFGNKEEKV